MPAGRDTRIEASRLRRLSPLQTLEDQSQTWGIRCHSCTWREGLTPSWKMKPPRSKLRGITRKGIVCETPRFLTLFPLQGNLAASSEESPDLKESFLEKDI